MTTVPSPEVLASLEQSTEDLESSDEPTLVPRLLYGANPTHPHPLGDVSPTTLPILSTRLPQLSSSSSSSSSYAGASPYSMNWTHMDMQFCMGAVEIDDYRRGRRRRVAYMVTVPGYPTRLRSFMQLAAVLPMQMMTEDGSEKRLPEVEIRRRQIARSLQKIEIKSHNNPKLVQILKGIFAENNDLDLYFLKKSALSIAASSGKSPVPFEDTPADIRSSRSLWSPSNLEEALDNFSSLAMQGGARNSLLLASKHHSTGTSGGDGPDAHRNRSSSSSFAHDMKAVRMEGAVAVCTGRRSWSEEWAVLNGRYFEIFMPQMAKHLRLPTRILISQIKSVSMLTKDMKPFEGGYEFFTIGTAARTYYFCVKNRHMLDLWLDALLVFQRPPVMLLEETEENEQATAVLKAAYPVLGEDLHTDSDEPEACIIHPGNFLATLPGVLNMRRVSFYATFAGRVEPSQELSPVNLSQELLRKIVHICNPNDDPLNTSFDNSNPSSYEWIAFSDRVCLLQTVALQDLTRDEITAFFLNIYHTLLTHAFIVYGVPGRPMEWKSFKSKAAYEIAGDVMSLRDIDEIILGNSCNQVIFLNILRNNISYTDAVKQCENSRNNWLSKGVLFPAACMHMGRAVDSKMIAVLLLCQNNPQTQMTTNGISSMENIDWRVALCISSGCTVASNEIVVFDGDNLDAQLDSRCKALLFRQIKIDLSPPTFLNSSNPSITMPLALSTLLLVSHIRTMRLISSPLLQTTSPDDPLFWLCSMEYFLSSALTSFTKSASHSDGDIKSTAASCGSVEEDHDSVLPPLKSTDTTTSTTSSNHHRYSRHSTNNQTELSIIEKLKSLEKAKKESETGKIHIFFNSPTYKSFRFLKLTTDNISNLERGDGVGDMASFTSTWNTANRKNARGRYEPVTTVEREHVIQEWSPTAATDLSEVSLELNHEKAEEEKETSQYQVNSSNAPCDEASGSDDERLITRLMPTQRNSLGVTAITASDIHTPPSFARRTGSVDEAFSSMHEMERHNQGQQVGRHGHFVGTQAFNVQSHTAGESNHSSTLKSEKQPQKQRNSFFKRFGKFKEK